MRLALGSDVEIFPQVLVLRVKRCRLDKLQRRRFGERLRERSVLRAPGSDQFHEEIGTSTVGGCRPPNPVHDWILDSFVGIQLAVGSQHLRLRNHIFGLTHRIMVKRLATSPHDPLGSTDSACKNQLVMTDEAIGIPVRTGLGGRHSQPLKCRFPREIGVLIVLGSKFYIFRCTRGAGSESVAAPTKTSSTLARDFSHYYLLRQHRISTHKGERSLPGAAHCPCTSGTGDQSPPSLSSDLTCPPASALVRPRTTPY
ncbi:hypothetical protein F511_25844 [Dorcoceras hygrometricum]|uniref:Uncharacterized protein n=1 Tax=Dorcoceras hygrometricum TaxID=472368 RepID=A0A2Z7B2V3_9LAMI|nr:hypothetical protein F511_25844 [Dorcoceras hygrometricum]